MTRLRTIARRSFLVGSVAIAGGVAFGGYLVLFRSQKKFAFLFSRGEFLLVFVCFSFLTEIDLLRVVVDHTMKSECIQRKGAQLWS